MRFTAKLALFAAGLLAPLAISQTAHAGIAACGNIHVEANAECEVRGGIECEGMCTPVAVRAQCAGNLAWDCRGGCEGNLEVDVECSGNCNADCMAECEADPPSFDCQGSCFADCEATARARCSTGDDECFAAAEGSCEAECQVSCEAQPAEVECSGHCEASCNASCSASSEAYLNCQVDCQRPEFPSCEASIQGVCEVACETEEGALFCDGNYVDHDGNLEECLDSLRGLLNVMVSGSASCSGNSCEAEGAISCSCTAADAQQDMQGGALFVLGGLFLFGLSRRRNEAA
jgi:hypothetical protein